MNPKIKIYGSSTFNPLKVVMTAEELGLDYEYEVINLKKGEHRTPEYKARHPFAKVPVLEVDGRYIYESGAICRYLTRIADNRLYSADPFEAAQIDQLIDTMSIHIGYWLSIFFWEESVKPEYFKKEPNPKALKKAADSLAKQLPHFDALTAKHDFLTGDEPTIADLFTHAYTIITEHTTATLDPTPNLLAWHKRMSDREAVKRAKAKVYGG